MYIQIIGTRIYFGNLFKWGSEYAHLHPNHRTSCNVDNALDLNSRVAKFESRPGHRISWLRYFMFFLSLPKASFGIVLRLGRHRFILTRFEIIVYLSSIYSALHRLNIGNALRGIQLPQSLRICFCAIEFTEYLCFILFSRQRRHSTRLTDGS
jgi:hypothetical protein